MVSFTTVSVAIVSVLSISQGVQAAAAIPMAISAGTQIIGGLLGGQKRDLDHMSNIYDRGKYLPSFLRKYMHLTTS
jgi:hypothetical protein